MDPGAAWGPTEELLAGLCELVDMGNRLFVQANSKKGTPPPRPIRIPRPGSSSSSGPARRMATVQELAAFIKGG